MEPYQQTFNELLVRHEVLRFGDFTLKSGLPAKPALERLDAP